MSAAQRTEPADRYIRRDAIDRPAQALLGTRSTWATPLVWKNDLRTEIMTSDFGCIRSYDPRGNVLWDLKAPTSNLIIPSPISAHGMVYVTSGYVGDSDRPVYAVRPGASGQGGVGENPAEHPHVAWSQPRAGSYNTSPIVYGEYYYTLLDRGFMTCHDARTGNEVYGKTRFSVGGGAEDGLQGRLPTSDHRRQRAREEDRFHATGLGKAAWRTLRARPGFPCLPHNALLLGHRRRGQTTARPPVCRGASPPSAGDSKYPQQFLPQLVITFLQFYGTTETEKTPRGERFLDNRKFEGPIPEMVTETVNHVLATIRKSSLIEGLFRRDVPEYPEEAVREAVLNSVAHRDYSPYVRGSYIQVRLFADRLEVQSPGGLYGNVTEENLEEESSTRNSVLMRLMEDLHLVENRGSGIRAMLEAMRRANLEPPRFEDKRSSFWVTFRNHTLMSPEAITWLNQFARLPLNDRQRLALVYLRYNDQITNSDYQRLNQVVALTAGRELRGLVQAGLVEQQSARRWTYYTLTVPRELPGQQPAVSQEERILAYAREQGSIGSAECQALLKVDYRRAWYLLKKLTETGRLPPQGKGRRYFPAET